MANSSDVDRWRKHLDEAEAELSAKTTELTDSQSFYCGVITKLARISADSGTELSKEINAIKKAASNPDDMLGIKKAVEELTHKIIQSEDNFIKSDIGDLGDSDGFETPGSELGLLLDKMTKLGADFPSALDVKQRLSSVTTSDELSVAIDDVAGLWKKTMSGTLMPSEGTAPDKEDASQFCALLISEILYQLLEKISFPNDVNTRLNKLKQKLDDGVTIDNWGGMLNQISDIATHVQFKLNRERLDIETFLKQVTGRLKDLDTYILGSKEQNAEAWKHGNALGDAVKNEMEYLVSNANDAADLTELKDQIQTRLAKIEDHVNGFRETEKKQHSNADEDVQRLMARLNELESESQNLKARVHKERMQAQVDALTGIANRLGYDHRVSQEYARWKRFGNPLTLVIWDVDLFKRINDDYGHAAGDKALKTIAKLLVENIRETDYLARYGGEEFVLIMPGANSESAKAVAEKLRQTVAESGFHFKGDPVSITISAGISEFKKDDTTSAVFERADKALYEAKQGGRNKVVLA